MRIDGEQIINVIPQWILLYFIPSDNIHKLYFHTFPTLLPRNKLFKKVNKLFNSLYKGLHYIVEINTNGVLDLHVNLSTLLVHWQVVMLLHS